MALSDVQNRGAKAAESVVKLSDGKGLQLWVTPAGGKIWTPAYRYSGAQKTLTIGAYPEITLAAARGQRDHAKRLLLSGTSARSGRRMRIFSMCLGNQISTP